MTNETKVYATLHVVTYSQKQLNGRAIIQRFMILRDGGAIISLTAKDTKQILKTTTGLEGKAKTTAYLSEIIYFLKH